MPSTSASHSFLDFEEAIGFHPFFASYFVLHNSYIRILAIHKYKSSWKNENFRVCFVITKNLLVLGIELVVYAGASPNIKMVFFFNIERDISNLLKIL